MTPTVRPAPEHARPEPAAAEGAEEPEPLEKRTILVVEDEPVLRRMAQLIYEDAGYAVLTAADGVEGCEVFESHAERIDLVLLDVLMPRRGGPDAARAIRRRRVVPILFSSGYTGGMLEGLDDLAGDTHLLCKPYSPRQLLAKTHEILETARF